MSHEIEQLGGPLPDPRYSECKTSILLLLGLHILHNLIACDLSRDEYNTQLALAKPRFWVCLTSILILSGDVIFVTRTYTLTRQ